MTDPTPEPPFRGADSDASPEEMALARGIAGNLASVAVGRLAVALLGVLLVAVLTRGLGADGYGRYRTVLVYLGFAVILADLGLHVVLLREISKPGSNRADLLGQALGLRLAAAAVVLVAAAAGTRWLPYDATIRLGVWVGALGYLAIAGQTVLLGLFQLELRQWQAVLAELVGTAALLGVTVVLLQRGTGVVGVLGAMAASQLLCFGLLWTLARRGVAVRPRFHLATWRSLAFAGLPIAGSHIFGLAIFRGDTVLLSLLRPAADVGLYGVAAKVVETGGVVTHAFGGLVMPLLARHAFRRPERFRFYLRHSLEAAVAGAGGIIVALVAFGEPIAVLIGGPRFAPAGVALGVLGVALALLAVSTVLRFAIAALERVRTLLWIDALAAALAVGAWLLLIPRFSILGAAAGAVLAQALALGLLAFAVARRSGGLPRLGAAGRIALAMGAALAGEALLRSLDVPWAVRLVATGAAYPALLVALGAIRWATLRELLGPPGASRG